ncbi:MAG: spore photoproduct lyase [bacterium]|jgi:spore photoproduct lyase
MTAKNTAFACRAEYIPRRVYMEPEALAYPLGRKLKDLFQDLGINIKITASHNRVTGLPGKTPAEKYAAAKQTLVIGVRKSLDFAPCKPSAHYQLPLATSCPGMCQYCYLATTLGPRPYVRVYVNIEEILARAAELIERQIPDLTFFEGAATSDPVPIEPYTGSLERTITFFARQEYGRFRFVTKFTALDSILNINHQGHTTVRFSINTPHIIAQLEHGTPILEQRLQAAEKISAAGYPLGFLIAPIFLYPGWQAEYKELLAQVAVTLGQYPLTFELISHRYTKRAKNQILSIFPGTALTMDEAERKAKYGQFGYVKYLYPPDTMTEMKEFFQIEINRLFPHGEIKYFV